jgi:hypothetical protein
VKRISIFVTIISLIVVVVIGYRSFPAKQSTAAAEKKIGDLIGRSDIISAIKMANRHDHLKRSCIDALWVAEYKNPKLNGQIAALMSTQLSRRLASDVAQSDGRIEQVMVFDEAGCLVGADHATHDYDQSDEDKWKRTVGAANLKPVFEGRDTDPKGTTDQVSQSVTDAKGKIIGGVTLRWCNSPGGCL